MRPKATHCRNGHPRTDGWSKKQGCITCRRERNRRSRENARLRRKEKNKELRAKEALDRRLEAEGIKVLKGFRVGDRVRHTDGHPITGIAKELCRRTGCVVVAVEDEEDIPIHGSKLRVLL